MEQQKGNLQTLVELGARGHYPLFNSEWLNELDNEPKKLNATERRKAKKITQRILQHRSFDRQKTVLFSLDPKERQLFIRSFFKLVEGKVLDHQQELH